MFTGIIEETVKVISLNRSQTGAQLILQAEMIGNEVHIGDSVAVNGCCLTVKAHDKNHLTFDLLGETLACTNLKDLSSDSIVNLERALAANGRLGGHFVQGHIDCTSNVRSLDRVNSDYRLELSLLPEFAHYVVCKGSIAINGVSLTVAQILTESFVVWIIPHTFSATNFKITTTGQAVNLEFDLLAKYIERLVDRRLH